MKFIPVLLFFFLGAGTAVRAQDTCMDNRWSIDMTPVVIDGKNVDGGLRALFFQQIGPGRQSGKEILGIGADGASAALTEAVGDEDPSVVEESGNGAIAAGEGKVQKRTPGFAVVVGNEFAAVGAAAGVVAQEGRNDPSAQGKEGGFAEFAVGIIRHFPGRCPCFSAVVGRDQERSESALEGVVGGEEEPSGVRPDQFVGDDSGKREPAWCRPASAVVRRFKQKKIRRIRRSFVKLMPDPVDHQTKSLPGEPEDARTVEIVRPIFRSFRHRMFWAPCPAPVRRFRLHDPGVGAVLVMRALAENTDQRSVAGQDDVRPGFIVHRVPADEKFLNTHGKQFLLMIRF